MEWGELSGVCRRVDAVCIECIKDETRKKERGQRKMRQRRGVRTGKDNQSLGQ